MTDPIADMLTRLRNANSAYHDTVAMPYSKIKAHIAEILQQEGYISGWSVEDAEVGKKLVVDLKFGPTRERSIAGIKRVSKPGLRVYAKKDNLPKVLGGLGVAIISTSSGLMTDRQAGKRCGRGSPRLRLVRGGKQHVTYWTSAHPRPQRRRRQDRRPGRHGQGPQGRTEAHGRRADRGRPGGRQGQVARPNDEGPSVRCTASPGR